MLYYIIYYLHFIPSFDIIIITQEVLIKLFSGIRKHGCKKDNNIIILFSLSEKIVNLTNCWKMHFPNGVHKYFIYFICIHTFMLIIKINMFSVDHFFLTIF